MEKTIKTPIKKTTAQTTPENAEGISEADMNKRRDKVTAYYKDNIKHLKVQLDYEQLLKDIEQVRAERVQHQMFLAQAMAPPPEEGEEAVNMTQEDFKTAMAAQDMPAKRTLKRTE